jgi:hypothetical protein
MPLAWEEKLSLYPLHDGLKKAEQEPFKALFGQIPAFSLTKERLEQIDPADYQTIHFLTSKGS